MMEDLKWCKSSFSSGAQECVEVAVAGDGSRYVRDTKDRAGGHLAASRSSWAALIAGVKVDD